MNKILILFLIPFFVSCQTTKKESHRETNKYENKDSLLINTDMLNQENMKIKHIDFKQNPAQEYYFTRKYRLTKESLSYFQGDDLKVMSEGHFMIAKKMLDSLPINKLNDEVIGHRTVELDIPDWTIEVYFEKEYTIYISSGELPDYLQEYGRNVWAILNYLDDEN